MEQKASLRQTLEQKRAKYAWEKIVRIDERKRKDYRGIVQRFPSLIQTNGLGQALAFLKAKAKDKEHSEHQYLYNHLEEWLISDKGPIPIYPDPAPNEKEGFKLINRLISNDSTNYRHATMEALALMKWLKRFAEALAPEDKDEG